MNTQKYPQHPSLQKIVAALGDASERFLKAQHLPLERKEFPSRETIVEIMKDLRSVLFPGFFGPSELTAETLRYHLGSTMDRVVHKLSDQIKRGILVASPEDGDADGRAFDLVHAFVRKLPEVRRLLGTDVQAAYSGDPAASSQDEVVLSYPGLQAIMAQRLAHELYLLRTPLIPRVMTEFAHSLTGIDIHPGARIGEGFFIDHGTGVVIGETAILGKNVRIYQGVTLGAKSFATDDEGNLVKKVDRHPIVEDDVVIYANATILGRITIGKGAVIGGNTWVTQDVPPGESVLQSAPPDRPKTIKQGSPYSPLGLHRVPAKRPPAAKSGRKGSR